MATPVLATTRYVEVGTYIGQFFLPGAGGLPNDVRVPCIVGKGDRLFVVKNLTIRRAFIQGEALAFSATAPFLATLQHDANGAQSAPTRLYTLDGNEISPNKWQFVQESGRYTKIQIMDPSFDPLAQYIFDYQSTDRTVVDQIPQVTIQQLSAYAEVRQLTAVGNMQDQDQFAEYVDYLVDFEIDPVGADSGNQYPSRGVTAVTEDKTGTGSLDTSPSVYSHAYNRVYTVECLSVSGVSPAREAVFEWSAAPVSFGNNALPHTPIHSAIPKTQITIKEADIVNYPLTNVMLELGVAVNFAFGASNFVAGDMFYFQANGAGLIEVDPRLMQTNQYTEFSAIEGDLDGSSTGSCAITSQPSAYTMTEHSLTFRLQCIAVTAALPNPPGKTATFAFEGYGTANVQGQFTVNPTNASFTFYGITVEMSFGANNFVVGDTFTFTVRAPRIFYKGKEAVRNVTLSIASAVYPAANRTLISGGFLTDTAEGRVGTWTADTGVNNGRFETNDGLYFYIRNAYTDTSVIPYSPSWDGMSRIASGDRYGTQARSLGTLDWSLVKESTETFSNPAQIATDVNGAVTGVVGAKYITAAHQPDTVLTLTKVVGGAAVTFEQVPNTPFLRLTQAITISDGDLELVYRWRGDEPEPGQVYYITGKFLRPAEMYNRPFLFLSNADAQAFLAPSTVRNDLYIGSSIAWEYAIAGLMVIQVKDADDDGVYSRDDYRNAINRFLDDKRATDLCVLNYFNSLPDQLNVINRANDPFEAHESITFVGCPIGTPVGSELQPGTMVYYSRKTLAVYGQSPAHGSRAMVGSTRATRTITLDDKSVTTVTLDGSFIACALMAYMDSFRDPRQTVLLGTITSFDTMETQRPEENLQLGGNNIIYFRDEGSGVYRIMEDITTDPFAPDTLNLNQMVQKQFVTRDIRRYMTSAVIGMVFPSASAGVFAVEAALANRLRLLLSRNLIGEYQDASGNVRSISSADTVVFRDPADPTAYNIGFNYFLATTAKRIFGLFTVNLPGGFPR